MKRFWIALGVILLVMLFLPSPHWIASEIAKRGTCKMSMTDIGHEILAYKTNQRTWPTNLSFLKRTYRCASARTNNYIWHVETLTLTEPATNHPVVWEIFNRLPSVTHQLQIQPNGQMVHTVITNQP